MKSSKNANVPTILNCAIKTCKEKFSGKIKMHGIPRSIDMMNKWLDTIRAFEPDFQTTTHTKICNTDYNLSVMNSQKVLKKSAIPIASMIEEIEVEESNVIVEIEVEENKVIDEIGVGENKVIYDVPTFEENLPGPSVIDSTLQKITQIVNVNYSMQHKHPIKKYQSTIRKLRLQNFNLKKKNLNLEAQLLKRQLHLRTGSYSPELRSFALTLNFYSLAAYNYVRQTFKDALPHLSTLRKWYYSVDAKPGFTLESLKAVKIKVKEMKSKGKKLICALMMDEMHIKENVVFKGDRLLGHVNYGTCSEFCDSLPKATQALVFMLVSMNSNWKVPVGYFLINGIGSTEKANLVDILRVTSQNFRPFLISMRTINNILTVM
ncbi:THAP domain-containing protein 1-like [Aphis craccivora]|uniref:THAP domain-containing protein 1-like n=1 Tax=Aphis craccivora TaxID=307492 RepID=A0A6G0VY30_APHCR|nr:THAP domain-containing protein 1-like [Aphis craccivora]